MERVCVFCGGGLINKTTEHILPRWLVEVTGDPKRTAGFGLLHLEDGEFRKREFSFDAFKFPACQSCNQKYAELEASTKTVVKKMISEDLLSHSELSTLMDWFDKVRIGLWLGYQYLDKNPMNIEPHYRIEGRMRVHDRVLAIFKNDSTMKGLSFIGCDTPLFAIAPCCFSICINNYCFMNLSYPNLISRRIGFPYPSESFALEDESLLYCRFRPGRNRIMIPVLKKRFSMQCKELYQPIFIGNNLNEEAIKLYDTRYVRDNCINWERGIGKIFISEKDKIDIYPSYLSKEWIPKKSYSFVSLLFELQLLTLEWQLYIEKLFPSVTFLSKEKKRIGIDKRNFGKYYNKQIIDILRKRGARLGISPAYLSGFEN